VHAIDSECPHEGAPLADGEINAGVVTCPWHGWTFNACNGCSIDPTGSDVRRYETQVENGKIFIRAGKSLSGQTTELEPSQASRTSLARPSEAGLTVVEVLDEGADVKTFRMDNSGGKVSLDLPGRFVNVCVTVDGEKMKRSFTVSSSPSRPEQIDLTIKLNPLGVVSRHLFESVSAGDELVINGPHGGFVFNPDRHSEPLVLVSAGSGITPMISIVRFLVDRGLDVPVQFFYGARSEEDNLFGEQCETWRRARDSFRYEVSLSAGSEAWRGSRGRLSTESILQQVERVGENRYFLCGPNDFMSEFDSALQQAGVPASHIHTEQFHAESLTTS